MAIRRASTTLGRVVFRRAATQSRTQAWRQTARRHASTGTASAEHAKKTSDIPWIIGSVAFTVPAAVWLFNQGPQKSDHHGAGHGEESEGKGEEEAPAEEESTEEKSDEKPDDESEDKPEEKSDEKLEEEAEDKPEEKSKDKSDDKPEESTDEKKESEGDSEDKKSDDSSSDGEDSKDTPDTSGDEDEYEKPSSNAPGQINYNSSMKKGPGEGQKGERSKSETKGEKDAASDKSGAQNPYLDDDEKSKKGEGLKETQKIHGTVDSNRPLR